MSRAKTDLKWLVDGQFRPALYTINQLYLVPSLTIIHTLHEHYAHVAANLNWGYLKYAKVVRMIIFVQLHSA